MGLMEKIFGSYSKKELARIEPIKQAVLDLEEEYSKLSEKELEIEGKKNGTGNCLIFCCKSPASEIVLARNFICRA